ncbi:MAG TPA: hypothetical protein VG602_00385 [Actinomycetota bacterium]|nr:hypothetical protein [Actinomycetota bacterium]
MTRCWVDLASRGQAGDIVLGDAGPNSLYADEETNSKIGDLSKLNELGYADTAILMFDERYDNGRYIEIQSADISPAPVHCTSAQIYVFSRSVPHWFNDAGRQRLVHLVFGFGSGMPGDRELGRQERERPGGVAVLIPEHLSPVRGPRVVPRNLEQEHHENTRGAQLSGTVRGYCRAALT